MQIKIAENTGFCMGVKNAVETATKVCGKGVYILGELIHNNLVTDKILSTGTKTINSIDEITSGTLIIRSHGVGKDVLQKLSSNKNVKVIDCTCPFVKKIHNIVEKYYQRGYQIVIVGEENHPEAIGINGWCEYSAIFVSNNYENINFDKFDKICIVCQTTFDRGKFEKFLPIKG